MSESVFANQYDCEVQFQYSFDGQSKQYYPIISHLHQEGSIIDLSEFSKYPVITFLESTLQNCSLTLDRIRDINFQHCTINHMVLELSEFTGTLGFARCSISLESIRTTTSPKILAFVGSEIVNARIPQLDGFDDLHTLALLDVGLDYLDLNPLLTQLELHQLIITELQESIPLNFRIPDSLTSLRLKHTTLLEFPHFSTHSSLEILLMEEVQIIRYSDDMLKSLEMIANLQELTISRTPIKRIAYLDLNKLNKLTVDGTVEISEKMLAKLRLQEVTVIRV